jgi:hypothetical protein
VFTLSKILKRDTTMHSKSTRDEFVRMPVPGCFHPNCEFHAATGQSVKQRMETARNADPIPELRMSDLFIADIQYRTESEATIKDLIGENNIFVWSECSFVSAVKRGVKRHTRHCKKGSAIEKPAVMFPDLVVGIQSDCHDERDLVNDDHQDLLDPIPKMLADEINELPRVWLRKLTEFTKSGVKIRHLTHSKSKQIRDIREVASFVHESLLSIMSVLHSAISVQKMVRWSSVGTS